MERKIEDIVEALITAKDRGKGCSLLIGARCSQTIRVSANLAVNYLSS